MTMLGRTEAASTRQESTRFPEHRSVDGRRSDDRRFDERHLEERAEAMRIERALNEEFEKSSYPPLRTLKATSDGDSVRLRGTVRTYYQKQIAQQAAMDLLKSQAATQRLVNDVEVVR